MEIRRQNTPASWARALIIVPMLLFVVLVYTFLHESGHALAGIVFGGRLTSFSANFINLSAHAGIDGDFTSSQRAIIAAAGITLPLLVWAAWMGLAPKCSNPVHEALKIIAAFTVINTLLAWIVIPFLYLANHAPADDSTNFLRITGIPPLLLSALVLLVYAGSWAWLFRRTGDWRTLVPRMQTWFYEDLKGVGSRRTFGAMGIITFAVVAVLAGLSQSIQSTNADWVPEGYTPVIDLDLAQSSYQSAPIFQFSLAEPESIGLYILMTDIETGPLVITLRGPGDESQTFIKFPAGKVGIGRATSNPKDLQLTPGDYQLILTAVENPGHIRLFVLAPDEN